MKLLKKIINFFKNLFKKNIKLQTNNNFPIEGELLFDCLELFTLINNYRENKVIPEKNLIEIANVHTSYMVNTFDVSHINFPIRLAKLKELGFKNIGECISKYTTIPGIFRAYLNSPKHKEIIDNPKYNYVGISIIKVDGFYYNTLIFAEFLS